MCIDLYGFRFPPHFIDHNSDIAILKIQTRASVTRTSLRNQTTTAIYYFNEFNGLL